MVVLEVQCGKQRLSPVHLLCSFTVPKFGMGRRGYGVAETREHGKSYRTRPGSIPVRGDSTFTLGLGFTEFGRGLKRRACVLSSDLSSQLFAHKNSSRLGFAEPKCLHRRTSRKRRWVLLGEDSCASKFPGTMHGNQTAPHHVLERKVSFP